MKKCNGKRDKRRDDKPPTFSRWEKTELDGLTKRLQNTSIRPQPKQDQHASAKAGGDTAKTNGPLLDKNHKQEDGRAGSSNEAGLSRSGPEQNWMLMLLKTMMMAVVMADTTRTRTAKRGKEEHDEDTDGS
ncbi:hypothetical protein VaNZ11_016810 [Volvox africanus]|uniref:Uncharacterized protein n=1 Tax=Volvox africanus TaxID=51714 RepID=A0ABQ5SPJ4_9CHLO|nr:hypothetical protein VaNZ11_016810 [Volvox africanus]